MHLADLMEKSEGGQFLIPVPSAATFSKQSVRSDGGDGFFQSNLEQISCTDQ